MRGLSAKSTVACWLIASTNLVRTTLRKAGASTLMM